jgi:hypothetical protein
VTRTNAPTEGLDSSDRAKRECSKGLVGMGCVNGSKGSSILFVGYGGYVVEYFVPLFLFFEIALVVVLLLYFIIGEYGMGSEKQIVMLLVELCFLMLNLPQFAPVGYVEMDGLPK